MKKNRRFLALFMALTLVLSNVCVSAATADINVPAVVRQFQNGTRNIQFDTPTGYDEDGNPIYTLKPTELENGETVYAAVMPIYNDTVTYDGAMVEIPSIAWLSARLVKSGESANMEITYNCFMLALATSLTVNGISTSGDLGKRSTSTALRGTNLVPGPYISVTKTFTGFNSYITEGTQSITVGAVTCLGVDVQGSAPKTTVTMDISDIITY